MARLLTRVIRTIAVAAAVACSAGCVSLVSALVAPAADTRPDLPAGYDPAAAVAAPVEPVPPSDAAVGTISGPPAETVTTAVEPVPDEVDERPLYETAEAPGETADGAESGESAGVGEQEQEDILDEPSPEGVGPAVVTPTEDGNPACIPDLTYRRIDELWQSDPAGLGSVSAGIPSCGRLENGVQMPEGPYWKLANPKNQWGTQETIDQIVRAITAVNQRFPGTPPLIVGNLSARRGGYLRPHHSHQAGRDVDFSLYPAEGRPVRFFRADARTMDIPRNWALVRSLITETDVQYILIDRQIQRLLREYALSIGEDPAWLEQVFVTGTPERRPIIQHVRRHRDHYHVRFFSPRAQQLGVLLHDRIKARAEAEKEKRDLYYRVRKGDTLGHLARRYRTTVRAIQRSNRMRSTRLRIGQTLVIPGRGGGNLCQPPTPLLIPPRLLPPAPLVSRLSAGRTAER